VAKIPLEELPTLFPWLKCRWKNFQYYSGGSNAVGRTSNIIPVAQMLLEELPIPHTCFKYNSKMPGKNLLC
jgi:hypothetical protein